MSSVLEDYERFEYLVYGYIRGCEERYELCMNIEDGVKSMIYAFYPKILRFDHYNLMKFDVSDDRLSIKGDDGFDCFGYIIYIESPEGKGFNQGIHYLSIKNVKDQDLQCFNGIGVMAEKRESKMVDLQTTDGRISQFEDSTFSFCNTLQTTRGWEYGTTITVKLDCNNWTVKYYKDGQKVKCDEVKPNKSYHFVTNFCANPLYCDFEVVFPDFVLDEQ